MWQAFEDTGGQIAYRAVCHGYLVFLTNQGGSWFVNVLMPQEEREKTYMAGPGFKKGVPLEEAQRVALEVTRQARAKLDRKTRALEREPSRRLAS